MKPTPDTFAAVDHAITTRHSIRAFLRTPVPRETIEQILAVAARAPSGTNTQPWQVHVLTGEAKAALSREIRAAYDDPEERARHNRIEEAMAQEFRPLNAYLWDDRWTEEDRAAMGWILFVPPE